MILYHGSYLEIQTPDLLHSKENVDFGRGFYTTPLYEQAAKWCEKFKRRGKSGIISRYNFDEQAYQKLKILNFDSYSEAVSYTHLDVYKRQVLFPPANTIIFIL